MTIQIEEELVDFYLREFTVNWFEDNEDAPDDLDLNATANCTALTNFSPVTAVAQQGASSVPEPGSLSLMLLGLAGLGLNAKRRRSANTGSDQ